MGFREGECDRCLGLGEAGKKVQGGKEGEKECTRLGSVDHVENFEVQASSTGRRYSSD